MNQPPEFQDTPATHAACIAIGSNLGDRRGIIESALVALANSPGVELRAISTVIETEPVGPPGQGPYLNAAVVVQTVLAPRVLLESLLAIERAHGRVRDAVDRGQGRWGPRRLDLDLLLYDDLVIEEPGLSVPHSRMHERLFVLAPLAEIAPDSVHPVLGLSIRSLKDQLIQSATASCGMPEPLRGHAEPASAAKSVPLRQGQQDSSSTELNKDSPRKGPQSHRNAIGEARHGGTEGRKAIGNGN